MTSRIILTFSVVTAIVLAATLLPLNAIYTGAQERDLEARIERDARTIADAGQAALLAPTPAARRELARTAARYEATTGGEVLVVDDQGRPIANLAPARTNPRATIRRPEIARALSGGVGTVDRRPGAGADDMLVAVPIASRGGVVGAVRVGVPRSDLDSAIREFHLLLAALSLATMAAVALLGLVLARSLTRPMAALRSFVKAVARGDQPARPSARSGPRDVRALAVDVEGMVAGFEEARRREGGHAASATDRLQSPARAIRRRLESALGADPESEPRRHVEAALGDLRRLDQEVEELRIWGDDGNDVPSDSPADVSRIVDDCLRTHRDLARRHRVVLRASPGPRYVHTSSRALERLLDNLVDRAVGASPPESEVLIRSALIDDAVEIQVVSDGSEESRVAPAGSGRTSGGAPEGPGLSVARRLAEACKGTIETQAMPSGALCVAVRLPPA